MRLSRPLVIALALLTVGALLPWQPLGPFDARSGQPVAGLHLVFPLWIALLEPLLLPARILAGAPDFRVAATESAVWLVAGAALFAAWGGRGWGRLGRALRGAGAVLLLILVYVSAMALVRVPLWQLEAEDPDLLIADLHSHTRASHDGLVEPRENLSWHQGQGYNVVAVTEHRSAGGGLHTRELAPPGGPGVIPGVEVRADQKEYLVALGLAPTPPVLLEGGDSPDYAARFVREVHERHGGAVVAMHWFLTPALVQKLMDAGVDGFEVANSGHPDLAPALREALLAAQRERGMVLVASTDWHGWGGASRTWTVARLPGSAAMTPAERAQAMVSLLRARSAAVTPVVAGEMGSPPAWRAVFAPWVETLRYATELTPVRVAALWAWAFGLAALVRAAARRGLRPARLLYAAALLLPALAVGLAAFDLLGLRDLAGAPHGFAREVAGYGLGVAGLGGAVGGLLLLTEWRRRRSA